MLRRVLSPVLVGRQEELSRLEDALLSANRGDGRFVLVAGEAGIEAFRRVASWLSERGLTVEPEALALKGFDEPQPAYRLPAPILADT